MYFAVKIPWQHKTFSILPALQKIFSSFFLEKVFKLNSKLNVRQKEIVCYKICFDLCQTVHTTYEHIGFNSLCPICMLMYNVPKFVLNMTYYTNIYNNPNFDLKYGNVICIKSRQTSILQGIVVTAHLL